MIAGPPRWEAQDRTRPRRNYALANARRPARFDAMWKDNAATAALVGVLAACALGTLLMSYRYVSALSEVQRLQPQMALANRNANLVQALMADVLDYSRRNPALDPVLQKLGVKAKPDATNVPAARPASR